MNVLAEIEDSLFTFVKERLPIHKWKTLTSRFAIEREMEDDDIDEIKERVFELVMDSISWNTLLMHIQDLADNTLGSESEEEKEDSDEE
jgi:hypothetical protein